MEGIRGLLARGVDSGFNIRIMPGMSERMADASLSVAKRILAGIVVEVDRARDSEAQKDAEISRLLAEKKFVQETGDATITALADALAGTAPVVDADGPCWCGPMIEKKNGRHYDLQCIARRSALRLAGRLP